MKKSHQTNQFEKNKNKIALSLATFLFVFVFFPAQALASDITPENIALLVNKERIYYGLSPLKVDDQLATAANNKSKDMMSRSYFEHYAYGLTPWDFIHNSGYNYSSAGENLAMNFQTSEGMVDAWMNSPLHRQNILNPDYEDMGIGISKGFYYENGQFEETTIVTNMFGQKKSSFSEAFDNLFNNFQYLFKW